MPSTTAAVAIVAPIPTRSTSLSFSPNVRIAKLFSHSGVASMKAPPTAMIGDDPGPNIAARSSAAPSAAAPASDPMRPPTRTRRGS